MKTSISVSDFDLMACDAIEAVSKGENSLHSCIDTVAAENSLTHAERNTLISFVFKISCETA